MSDAAELWAMLAVEGCWFEFHLRVGSVWETDWVPCEDRRRFLARCFYHDSDQTVSAVPRGERDPMTPRSSGALWAVVQAAESRRLLEAFQPRPTMVLRMGDEPTAPQIALWALLSPLDATDDPGHPNGWGKVERCNRALSVALKTPRKPASPDFMFPPVGAYVRRSRNDQRVTRADNAESGLYAVSDVIGRLPKTLPDPNRWRRANPRPKGRSPR